MNGCLKSDLYTTGVGLAGLSFIIVSQVSIGASWLRYDIILLTSALHLLCLTVVINGVLQNRIHHVVLVLAILLSGCSDKKQIDQLSPDSQAVRIVTTMHNKFDNGNTVHCANVEYLWNLLRNSSDRPLTGNALAREFDQSLTWAGSMDTSRFVLAFGDPAEVYASITRQYKNKYNIVKSGLIRRGSTFWGYTDKVVNHRYAEPFDEQKLMFQGVEVAAFGFSSGPLTSFVKEHFKDQFDIVYFDHDGQFVVRLNPVNSTDEIVLAMLERKGSFVEMYKTSTLLIDSAISSNVVYHLNADDELIMPVISFKASRAYHEVEGLKFSSDYGPVEVFEQLINFSFDRSGVVLESTASVADSVGFPQQPKILHFNKPFFLYIKEKDAPYPYFNLWVSDTSILQPINTYDKPL